jgi:hypothetical protein
MIPQTGINMAEDYVEKQQKEYQNINKHLEFLKRDAEDIWEIVDALKLIGNETLAGKLDTIASRIKYRAESIDRSRKQETDNYMELDQQSQKEFFETLARQGVVKNGVVKRSTVEDGIITHESK